MFDRYVISGGPRYTSVTSTVTEKRAPTDDSVKLLREMEQKALDSVVDGFLVQGNALEVVALEFGSPGFSDQRPLYYAYKLNGRLYKGEIKGPTYVQLLGDKEATLRLVIDDLSKKIAIQLLSKVTAQFSEWVK